jgi:hypothetical protein
MATSPNFAHLICLSQVPDILPARPSGGRLNPSTIWRWVRRGAGGRRLRAVRIGRSWYTSAEWLAEFLEPAAPPESPAASTPNLESVLAAEEFLRQV